MLDIEDTKTLNKSMRLLKGFAVWCLGANTSTITISMYNGIVKQSTCFDGEELIFASRVVSISRGEPEAPSAPGDLTPVTRCPYPKDIKWQKFVLHFVGT